MFHGHPLLHHETGGGGLVSDYIERERIEKFFDGIYDCADLTFEPNDHCCAADDCAHCKWHETKNAIKKRILSIPAADVRPMVNTCETCGYKTEQIRVKPYDGACCYWKLHSIKNEEWCCHWKKREEADGT
jgi:hypothetical protein